MRFGRFLDLMLAVCERGIDFCASAELDTEEDFNGIGELLGQINDNGVKANELCGDSAHRGHHSSKD